MCHSLRSQAAVAGGLGLHSDFRAAYKHVWSGLETKQYPLLDDTENAGAVPGPPSQRTSLLLLLLLHLSTFNVLESHF